MGQVTSCSYPSVASLKSLRLHAQERSCSTGTPVTVKCHQLALRTGRKWQAEKEVQVAESRVRQKALVGSLVMGRAGLVYFPKPQISKAQGKERHYQFQEEIQAAVEEERVTRVVGLRQFDVLPSPANLHAWGKKETSTCLLCSGRGSLEHLLSSCPKALVDGRYRWCHDQVIKAVAESIASAISTSEQHHAQKKVITFIKELDKPQARLRTTTGLVHTASDWQLLVDLGRHLKFPQQIAETSLCPDMIITSAASKHLIMLELTVPWEERMEEANERKHGKYCWRCAEAGGRAMSPQKWAVEALQVAPSAEFSVDLTSQDG
ncbi:hypothetical protein P4O66_003040 [Electrophorus voltai]|uniref:Reverse transcriptase zinc-binding domain-containing protein n=1 Tax=Electrophorus voltai TaxID=2609070 RepID=A0AAD9DNW9_9TELE|nr:hypothetical protein P4O66_003040 [Electrophorus voltai]